MISLMLSTNKLAKKHLNVNFNLGLMSLNISKQIADLDSAIPKYSSQLYGADELVIQVYS